MAIDKYRLFNNVYRGKKVLLTGDTGFKGSWLAIWLRELGAEVYGFALPPKTKKNNYVISGLHKLIHHKDGDIRSSEELYAFFREVQPDFAFHLAAQALVLDSYSSPAETFHTNVLGTVHFFEAIRKTSSVKAAVNITSDKCYQNKEQERGYRESDPMGGKDPYSASKGCAELVTSSYLSSFFQNRDTCNIASARAGNVIGGGDRAENRIIPDFFKSVSEKSPLLIRNPFSVRPWQHVLEPLGGYLLLGERLYLEGKQYSGGWNFGPEESNHHTVKELIDTLITFCPEGSYVSSGEKQALHEAGLLKLDISKAENELGWKPVLNFDETVEFTAKGYIAETQTDNIYSHRLSQIENYIQRAIHRNRVWITA